MEDWLAVHEVSLREWMDHIRRQTARARAPLGLSALVARHSIDAEQLDAALRVDLICTGMGENLATELAGRAAAAAGIRHRPLRKSTNRRRQEYLLESLRSGLRKGSTCWLGSTRAPSCSDGTQ